MSLKENFYQALRELLNNGGLVGSDLEEKAKSGSDLDAYIETTKGAPKQEAPDAVKPSDRRTESDKSADKEAVSFKKIWESADQRRDAPNRGREDPFAQPQDSGSDAGNLPFNRPEEETTVISKNSYVDGNIRSFANVTIQGGVRGKVDAMKDVNMLGVLVGDLTCNNAEMQGSSIQGNVFTKGNVFIDNDSVLLGNMKAQYASIDGKVKGNIEVGSKIEFHSNAVILGDIKTGSISIEDGANIQGYINTAYLMEHGETAFPNEVVIDDMEN